MQIKEQEKIIQGTPGSAGFAFGPVHVVARGFSAPDVYEIPEEQIPEEQARFEQALDTTKKQLDDLRIHIDSLSDDGTAITT